MIKTEMDNLAVEEQKIMDAEAKGEARQLFQIWHRSMLSSRIWNKFFVEE